jgi:small-conductance mechanosensitive channel
MIDYLIIIKFFISCIRIFILGFIGWFGSQYAGWALRKRLLKMHTDTLSIELFSRAVTYLIFFIALVAILKEFGVDVSGLVAAAGVIGVAVGFAARTSVANIISGLFIMIESPFELGDQIKVGDALGIVKSMNLFAITLYTDNNSIIRIPNESLLKSNIENVTRLAYYRDDVIIHVVYDQDLEAICQFIHQKLVTCEYVLKTPAPVVVIQEITGDYASILIGAYIAQQHKAEAKQKLVGDLKKMLQQQKITLYSSQIMILKDK